MTINKKSQLIKTSIMFLSKYNGVLYNMKVHFVDREILLLPKYRFIYVPSAESAIFPFEYKELQRLRTLEIRFFLEK